jgi:hypothetical protein
MAGADDYAKFQAERQQARAAAAASVVRSLRETNPDQKAKATTVSGVLGVPDQIYESNPAHFDALLEERFNKELLRRSPRLSTALTSDPRLAALAHDDLQNLGFWEGALNSVYRGGLNIEKAAAVNLRNEGMQREADKGLTFSEIYQTERDAEALTPEALRPFVPFDAIAAIGRWKEARLSELMMGDETERALGLNQRANEIDAAISEVPSTVRSTAAKKTFNDTYEGRVTETSGDLDKASAAIAAIGETFSTDPLGASEFLINTFLESAPMLAGAATVGLATKNPNAAAAFTYAMSSSLERSDVAIQYLGERGYDLTKEGELERLLKDPAMMRDANARAAISGMIVGGFDALSMKITGVQMTDGGFREVLAQTGAQMVLGGGGAYAGREAAGMDADFRDVLLEALLEIPGMPFDAVAVGRNILKDNRAAEAAQARRDMFTAISDTAQASKLRGRMPKAYAAFVDQVTKGGPLSTLYVPAQQFVEYFQSQGIDPEMVASSLNLTPETLAAAVDAGGDLSIPTAAYAEKVAGSKHDMFFMDNMRVSPDEMTMAEAKDFEAKKEALTAEAQGEAEKAQAQAQLEQTAVNQMFTRVRAALISAGRSTVEADTNAAVYPAFFTAMSERAGMTPEQLMDRIGLPRIEGVASPVAEDLATEPDLPAVLSELRAAMAPAPVEGADPAAAPMDAPAAPADERMAAIKDYLDQIGADLSMADDEIAALIEGDVMLEDSPGRRYAQELISRTYGQAEAPKIEGQSKAAGNKHGLMPHLRAPVKVKLEAGRKPLFAQTTMNSTAPRQIAAIDEVLARHPEATASVKNWNAMMADALASDDVPVPPYAFLRDLNGEGSFDLLSKLSEGQIADADHGFENAAAFRAAYTNGEISIEDTGRLFLWSFLSRGVSPYTQESLFIDSFYGIDEWIKAAADGTLQSRLDEYKAWTAKAAPKGSGQPGAGATHNLNAFGDTFLLKMSMDAGDGTGRSRLQVLHDMMSDPASTGKDVRRKFLEMGEGVGIDNKVVSFTLLVAGFTDVMVLDRVQIRQLWNDGRFDGINLYDGYKDADGKPVAGSALSNLTYGARGLLIYEAIEQGLQQKITDLYAKLGRPDAASVGRYHWETWVASSQQEASHATIDAILAAAKGARAPLEGVTAKEGEYGAYAYGARYGRDGVGVPYFLYSVPGVGDFRFTVEKFREFLGEVKLPKNGVVPGKFKVTESGNGPWYNRPEVSIPKLGEVAGQFGERLTAEQIRAADEADVGTAAVPGGSATDQPGPSAGQTYAQGAVDAGRPEQGGDGRGRQAGGSLAPLEGAPTVEGASGPDPRLTAVAEGYAQSIGLKLARQAEFVTVDPERGARIAAAYEAMEDAPQDPAVKEAYQNLIDQTLAQYRALEAAGYQFWFIDIENDGGYADSPWNAMRDLRANQRMGVFPTTSGYGTGVDVAYDTDVNPLLADTGIEWSFGGPDGPKKPVLANDLFRAVHDAFGHGLEGSGFRARGEENAWQAHVRLFTGSAVAAITSETRGQNSWLNFGPYGDANRTAKVEDTVFAEQKIGLMPSWTWEEGRAGDMPAEAPGLNQSALLFQNMAGTNRGSISLPANGLGKGETIIRLFASADLSTFMHESGHFFLSALQVLAADPQATPEIQSMYQTVKDWWLDNAGAVASDGSKVTGTKITADDVLNALANGTTGDRAKDIAVDVGMQEQWARGFELYLLEGKAPSVGLRAVFERMSAWLKQVYTSALRLNVKISPELRTVFDRLLATDEQMQAAQEDMSDAPLFESAEQAGMTPEEFKVLLRLHEEARGQMMADLLEQTMEPIRRQRMQSWKEERAKVEGEVRADVASRPVYAAIAALRFGRGPSGEAIDPPVKLSRDAIKASYPGIDVGKLPGATKDGKGHKNAVFSTDEGGMHPDIVASMYGYQTGGDLLLDLATAPDMEGVIKAETDAIMAERYPDPMTDGTIADEAIIALHNDKRAAALERELAALTKMAGEGKAMTAKEARAIAQATLKGMQVKTASKPQAFLAAERRAGREALRLARLVGKQGVRAADARQAVRSDARGAVRSGEVSDPAGMADTFDASNAAVESKATSSGATRKGYNDNLAALVAAKRQQLLNHALYNEARKIEAAVDSVTAKISKLNKADSKLSKARDINHVKAARAIAAKFGMARGDTSFDFAMWIEQLAVDDPLTVSAMVSAIETYGQDAKPYTDLTVLQFRAVSDAINSVLDVGKALRKAEIDGKAEDRDEIIAELTDIAATRQKGRELGETRRLTKGEQRNVRLLSFRASLIRVEAWARDMDDGGQGPFNRFIVKPVQDALGRYRDDRIVRLQQMLDILNPRRKELLGPPISAPELTNAAGDPYTFENKGELLHAILHTGNDSNMQKLLIGRGWSSGFVNRKPKMTASGKPSVNRQGVPILDKGVLDTSKWDAFMERMYREGVITKEDIDTAVKIWRLMDETKRPAQTAHKRIYGYYFGEIEPRMVDTPFGPVLGGYVPAIGDRLASTDAGRRQAEAAMEASPGTSMFPTTGSGFTKGRVEQYTTPLELNLMLLPSHLDKVLRFTHIEPIIRQTASIVNDKGFRAAMLKVDPKIIDVMVIPWLQRSASQTVETRATNDGDWQHWRLWATIRRRAGISTMFANVVNTVQQITGLSTAALLVKPSRLASSTVAFMGSPMQTRETVMASSSYMRNRMGNQSQDLSRRIEDAVVKPTTLAEMEAFISKHGYFMQTAFQNVIDPIVWMAAYDQAVAGRMTHEQAVFEADSVVRRTQSDIQPENVSSFEAGSPFARLFSMFYSYFNAQANLVGGEMATAIRTLGWNGMPRYAFIYAFGIAIPAIAAEAIVQASRGELGDEDDDGWEDDLSGLFLGSQVRYVTAFLPFVGNITNAVVGRFTSAFYDDRLSTSPALSFVERAASAPASVVKAIEDPDKTGRAVGDTATLLALLLGVPAGQFAKTTGFLFDASTGKQDPETPLDVTRGLITGRSGT